MTNRQRRRDTVSVSHFFFFLKFNYKQVFIRFLWIRYRMGVCKTSVDKISIVMNRTSNNMSLFSLYLHTCQFKVYKNNIFYNIKISLLSYLIFL